MYDERIEGLIKAALADGMLTEKEKQVLFKRAQEQGIDLDEFEMVLDARLVELQKEEKEKAAKSAPKSNKFGDVRKCPACGALIPSLAGACPDCGYEISGIDANLSSKLLAEQIAKIQAEYNAKINSSSDMHADDLWELNKQRTNTIAQTIKSFAIPNTKADLFEFITTMQANMLNPGIYKIEALAYFTKYNESILKAGCLYNNDRMFSALLENRNKVLKEFKAIQRQQQTINWKPSNIAGIGSLIFILLVCIVLGILMHFGIIEGPNI